MAVADHRQTAVIRNNLSGDAVRILLSNAGNKTPVDFDFMELTVSGRTPMNVTLNGSPKIHLDANAECQSDEITVAVKPGEPITISTGVSGSFPVVDSVTNYSQWLNNVTREGRLTYPLIGRKIFSETYGSDDCMWLYGFRGIQVRTDEKTKTVAAFGDSITHMSHWTVPLTEFLYEKYPGTVAVKNCGIGGNRLLRDSSRFLFIKGLFGPAGTDRFESDVFGEGHTDTVLVMEGVNDIAHPVEFKKPGEVPTAEDLIRGFEKLADIAHRRGAKIYLCTILPFGGYKVWNDGLENTRRQVNDWIRTDSCTDGHFDLDPVISEGGKGVRIDGRYHAGDHLHPNAEGGKKIAEYIDGRLNETF
jgi:lysophospholipase L1-like esterase